MLSARVTFMSVYSYCPGLQIRELTFQRLVVRARDTAYTEENIKKAFGSTGIYLLNPRMVLGKLRPVLSGGSRNATRPDNDSETVPPPITPTAPRAINHLKRHALQMVTRNAPSSNKLKVLIDQLGRAAEGAAADKDLSTGMPRTCVLRLKIYLQQQLGTAGSFLKLG